MRSSTVGTCVPPGCSVVESDLGSQPICMTVWPRPARAAARLQVVVDFPMPPLPYIASRYIASPFPLNTQKRAGRPPAFPPALYDCKACVRHPLCGGALGEMHLCCNPHVAQAKVYGLVRFVRCKRHVARAGLLVRRLFAGYRCSSTRAFTSAQSCCGRSRSRRPRAGLRARATGPSGPRTGNRPAPGGCRAL